MWAVAKFTGGAAGPLLIDALEDSADYVRARAATALGMLRETRAVEKLIALMSDASVAVRKAAATALGNIGSSSAEQHLVQAMENSSGDEWNTMRNALISLRKKGQDQSCIVPPWKK
jgi:HEAT repeat protein